MIRFQCIHCGGRIAVPDDHTDRLAQCPECGGVTHPLAEHLKLPPNGDSAQIATPKVSDSSICDNCGGPLGKLQKPFEWDGHFVCGPCHRMLSLDHKDPEPEMTLAVRAPAEILPARVTSSPAIVIDESRGKPLPSEFALIVRTACIGLVVTAAALYLIVSILQNLGWLFVWGAGVVVVLAVIYWVRRGVVAIRRRARRIVP